MFHIVLGWWGCYKKKKKAAAPRNRRTGNMALQQAAGKGHSQEVSFEQRPVWGEEGSHADGCLEKCVPSRWASKHKGNMGLWLSNWSLELAWLNSHPGSATCIWV